MNQVVIKAILIRVFHTFWQAFLAVFLLGITNILSAVLSTHNLSDAKSALIALVVAGVASGLAALKNLYVKPQELK